MLGLIVVKFGGSIAGASGADPVLNDCVMLARTGYRIAIVHGGGPAVDAELLRRNLPVRRLAGLRVTDGATLAVVEDVLGRRVNAAVVDALRAAGGRAERVGGDDGVFEAEQLVHPDGDLGFVGAVRRVDPSLVERVLTAQIIPVVSPVGADRAGQRYNINADIAAGALAVALGAEAYVVVTDVPRVRRNRSDPSSGIVRMTVAQAHEYRAAGTFTDGMIPKIDAAVEAVRGGVARALVCGAGGAAVSGALSGAATTIVL